MTYSGMNPGQPVSQLSGKADLLSLKLESCSDADQYGKRFSLPNANTRQTNSRTMNPESNFLEIWECLGVQTNFSISHLLISQKLSLLGEKDCRSSETRNVSSCFIT